MSWHLDELDEAHKEIRGLNRALEIRNQLVNELESERKDLNIKLVNALEELATERTIRRLLQEGNL